MLLIVGIFLIVVGISDFVVAAVLARQQTSATGGLGDSQAPPVSRMLRRTGAMIVWKRAEVKVVAAEKNRQRA